MNNTTKSILLTPFNLLYKLSPELDLKILFRLKQGYPLDLRDPKTYNEKLQWLKLYDRNPLMPVCCDKFAVRDFVARQGCVNILNRLIWEGFDPAGIPFDTLPEKCAIKVTHGSSFNILCRDTSKLDRTAVVRQCRRWLREKYLPCYGEWFYDRERPRVIVEGFIESEDGGDLKDYKIYCFHGEPKLVAVHSDRFTAHKKDLYDIDWHYLKDRWIGAKPTGVAIEKPRLWNRALECARRLSEPFAHARVDFYIEGDRLFFGEITFIPGTGFDRFSSREFDLEMGSWIDLSRVKTR